MSELGVLIQRLASSQPLLTGVEEATRQGAVIPVLDLLGWNWRDLSEVVPEYSIGTGRVDYALAANGQNLAFIEVKRAGTELDGRHQQQLLQYAFGEGVPLAVLTDGLIWWLYLPLRQGSWEERKFFSVDIHRVDPESAAGTLTRYLARDAVVSGEAVRAAEQELRSRERADRIVRALPVAWEQLLTEPDELLSELLTETVAGIAGASPDAAQVADFLLAQLRSVPGRQQLPTQNLPALQDAVSVPASERAYTGRTPVAFRLDGTRREVTSWRDILVGVANILMREQPARFEEAARQVRGRKRQYFSTDPDSLVHPLPLQGGRYFAEGNWSANSHVRLSRRLLVAVRGNDDSFEIETRP